MVLESSWGWWAMARAYEGDDTYFDGYDMQTARSMLLFTCDPFHLNSQFCRGKLRKSSLFSKGAFYFTICLLAVTMYCATLGTFYSSSRDVHTSSMRPEEPTGATVIDRVSNVLSSRGERTQSLLRTQVCLLPTLG